MSVLQPTEADRIGAKTEVAPASDTATSGLNGRLQRIAQRITSLIALLPASLGQKAMSASLAVAVANDQSAIPVTITPSSKLIIKDIAATTLAASASTYTTGDVIGGLITLTDVLSSTDFLGKLHKVIVRSVESTTPKKLGILIFNSNPSGSTINDTQGLDIADADDEKVIDVIIFQATEFGTNGNNMYATQEFSNKLLKGSGGDDLYAVLVAMEDSWIWGTANGMGVSFIFEQVGT